MNWIHELTPSKIDSVVTRQAPGVYLLYGSYGGKVLHVGRSDSDVREQLKSHLGQPSLSESTYEYFEFIDYCTSARDAFERESNLWHLHKPPDNPLHPKRAAGKDWKCPRCNIFDQED